MANPKISLTIFLLRPQQVTNFEQTLLSERDLLPLREPLEGVFLPIPSLEDKVPIWVNQVGSLLAEPITAAMTSRSPGGLMVVRRNQRTFVLAFGHAWQKLDDQWVERDFGLRIALNAIPKEDVIEIKAEQVFAKWHLSSERAPRASAVSEFGVDFDRDLVAAVEGIPKLRPELGLLIRGSVSLRVKLPIAMLPVVLDLCSLEFDSFAYKANWPEIDKISQLKDDRLVVILEEALDADLSDPLRRDRIVMFTPSQRRGESILANAFVYGRMLKAPASVPYLTVQGWVSNLARNHESPSVASAKRSHIHLLDDDGAEVHDCSAFQCFGYEYSDGNETYILSSGVWYEVVTDFVQSIEARLKQIPLPTISLPLWNGTDREGVYNAACCVSNGLLNFDAKNLNFGGGQSKFEFCDVFDPVSKTLFFAKIVSRSSGMSHLTEQVRRTAQLLFEVDSGYRKELQDIFAKHHPNADSSWLKGRPRHGDWNLCMVSLGRASKDLPFFAKCGLAKLYKDLTEQGHTVSFLSV